MSRNFAQWLTVAAFVVSTASAGAADAPIPTSELKNLTPEELQQVNRLANLDTDKWNDADGKFIATFCNAHPQLSTAHGLLCAYLKKNGFATLATDEAIQTWRLDKPQLPMLLVAVRLLARNGTDEQIASIVQEGSRYFATNFDALVKLALVLQVEKKDEIALDVIASAEKLKHDDPQLVFAKAHSLMALKRYDEAEASAKFLQTMPNTRALGLSFEAEIRTYRNQMPNAVVLLREAYKLVPTDSDLCRNFFLALQKTGNYSESFEPGLMAITKLTGSAEAKTLKKMLVRSMHRSDIPRLEKAAEAVAGRLQDPKELSYLFFSVGDISDNLGSPKHAIAYYQLGLKVNPGYGRAYMRLAKDLERVGMNSKQVNRLYGMAVHLSPDDKECRQSLARNESRVLGASRRDVACRIKSSMRLVSHSTTLVPTTSAETDASTTPTQ